MAQQNNGGSTGLHIMTLIRKMRAISVELNTSLKDHIFSVRTSFDTSDFDLSTVLLYIDLEARSGDAYNLTAEFHIARGSLHTEITLDVYRDFQGGSHATNLYTTNLSAKSNETESDFEVTLARSLQPPIDILKRNVIPVPKGARV